MSDDIPPEMNQYKYRLFIIRFTMVIIPLLGVTMLLAPLLGVPRLPTAVSLELWAIWLTLFFLLSFLIVGLTMPLVNVYSWKLLYKLTSEDEHEVLTDFRDIIEDWDEDGKPKDEKDAKTSDDSNLLTWD